MVPGSSTQNDALDTLCNLKQSQGHARRHQTSTPGRVSIPTSDPKLLRSLVRLEQNAMSQRKAVLAFRSRDLASQPTKPLLDKIKAHRKGLMTTLAEVTILWCQHGSIAMRLQEDLKMKLQNSIEDIDNLKHSLTDITVTGNTIIRAR